MKVHLKREQNPLQLQQQQSQQQKQRQQRLQPSSQQKISEYQATILKLKQDLSMLSANTSTGTTNNRSKHQKENRDEPNPTKQQSASQKREIKANERTILSSKVRELESVYEEKIETLKQKLKRDIKQEADRSNNAIQQGYFRQLNALDTEYITPIHPQIAPLSWDTQHIANEKNKHSRKQQPWWNDSDTLSCYSSSDDESDLTSYSFNSKQGKFKRPRRASLYNLSSKEAFLMLKSHRGSLSFADNKLQAASDNSDKVASKSTAYERNFKITRSNNHNINNAQQPQASSTRRNSSSLYLNHSSLYESTTAAAATLLTGQTSAKSAAPVTASAIVTPKQIQSQYDRLSTIKLNVEQIGHYTQNGNYFAAKRSGVDGNLFGKTKKNVNQILSDD